MLSHLRSVSGITPAFCRVLLKTVPGAVPLWKHAWLVGAGVSDARAVVIPEVWLLAVPLLCDPAGLFPLGRKATVLR